MTKRAMLGILLAFCAVTTFGYWRYKVAGHARAVAQFVIIKDHSDSIQNDCGRVVGLTERALAMPDAGKGSTIALFASGDRATSNEPRLLGELRVPAIRRVIEGQRAAAREKDELLANVKSWCGEVAEARVSPIFQAIKRGVQHLQGVGATGDLRYVFIQTDGEETENPQITKALNYVPGTKSALPPPIQNEGVRVTFCGMAETVGEALDNKGKVQRKSKKRDWRRADRLQEVWSGVFTNPELVSFEPYCSK